jgi:hypothetical protein
MSGGLFSLSSSCLLLIYLGLGVTALDIEDELGTVLAIS